MTQLVMMVVMMRYSSLEQWSAREREVEHEHWSERKSEAGNTPNIDFNVHSVILRL